MSELNPDNDFNRPGGLDLGIETPGDGSLDIVEPGDAVQDRDVLNNPQTRKAMIRKCKSSDLNTGQSKCQLDFSKVKGALIVAHGSKLPESLTAATLEAACHADRPNRVMPVFDFVEYAPNGGEAQVSAVGYGPNQVTGLNARTDTFTMAKYSEQLASAITKAMNTDFDVYFVDEKNYIYGINDGSDRLAGFPMSTIYHGGAPHPTSSAKATQTISFCHADAQAAVENFDYMEADFNVRRAAIGLVPVKCVNVGSTHYKIVEAVGGYDRTPEFAQVATGNDGVNMLVETVTSISYNERNATLSFTASPALDGAPHFKSPSVLHGLGIKGMVFVE